jgi:competence protein ComEA
MVAGATAVRPGSLAGMHAIPTRRLLVYVAAGLVVLAVGVAGLWAMRGEGDGGGVVIEGETTTGGLGDAVQALALGPGGATAASSSTTTTGAPRIWVQVVGAVRRPGVYQVPADARAFEAVTAAGGFAADADQQSVALAARLSDGCRLYVPREGETASGQLQAPAESSAGISTMPGGEGGAAHGAGPVPLNSATAEELDALPGVGPALAQQIIAYREANGPFTSVDQLDDVPGIGPAKLEQLRPLVCL